MASISKQPKEMQERHKRILTGMLKMPENRECADCRARNPTWASTNLGVFLCIRCSGLHRQVGVHITKVKSCTMDLWAPEQVAHIQKLGNAKGKAIYEAKLPPHYGKPAESEDSGLVLQWIRAKYEKKKFIHDNPQSVIDSGSASSAAGASAGGTAASPAGEVPRMVPGRARRDRAAKQQPSPQPAEQQGFGQAPTSGFGDTNDGFSSGAGFGFDSAPPAQDGGFTVDSTGGGFGFASASSPDGTASPAFGVMPGSAFGFVASPVAQSPREGFNSFPTSGAPQQPPQQPQPRGEDPLDFSYANGGARTSSQAASPAAAFDPFADVDAAQQQASPAAASPAVPSPPPSLSSPQLPGTQIGTAFAAAGGATDGDFEAQMRAMQQQLAAQQAYLDSLQQGQPATA
eukprot:CAMPEP_0174831080 /NCGR_PEP_ID=MMETSP1114-20130205/2900_1 /TAXON_ID=312471 /ORGANISM="Neobodo designis, Strain CCAP 1951/1" /LENGTH=401 /DNA_ID=CAMNT_0016064901 /DNA_START=59 /DNA_END=1264 /DNA_ORIENTATION=-